MKTEPIIFNSKGYLVPNLNIRTDIATLEREFVNNLNSEKRKSLFGFYTAYSDRLKSALGNVALLQWIDGSFATKKPDPGDFDVVTFINHDVVKGSEDLLSDFKYPNSLGNFGIDGYIVLEYPRDHTNYPLYIGDRAYWMDLFDKTRRNRNGVKYPKGFIEVLF